MSAELDDEAATEILLDIAAENGILSKENRWLMRELPIVGLGSQNILIQEQVKFLKPSYGEQAEVLVERSVQYLCRFGDLRFIGVEELRAIGVLDDEIKLFWGRLSPLHRVSLKLGEELQLSVMFFHFLNAGHEAVEVKKLVRANTLVFGESDDQIDDEFKRIPLEMTMRAKQWIESKYATGRGQHRTWNDYFWSTIGK